MSSVSPVILFLAWFYSPDRPKSTRDPSITILGSQLTGLARLSYNRKVDFCCVQLWCRDLCKAGQSSSCNQALKSIARFYALSLDLTDLPSEHTQNFSPPDQLLYWHPNLRSHSVLFSSYSTWIGLFCLKRNVWTNPFEKKKTWRLS